MMSGASGQVIRKAYLIHALMFVLLNYPINRNGEILVGLVAGFRFSRLTGYYKFPTFATALAIYLVQSLQKT